LTIHIAGTLVDGPADKNLTDVLAVYNEANDPDLDADALPAAAADAQGLLDRPGPRGPVLRRGWGT
jgi:hypothetical protein